MNGEVKVFVAGPRLVTYLDDQVKSRLDNVVKNRMAVLVGDAGGVDRLVQNHLLASRYDSVMVYASASKPRNNAGNWPVITVMY